MEFFKEIFSFLKSNQPRKFMYTLLLFFSLCYLVPVSYSSVFDKIDIGILSSKNIFYIVLFIVSFLLVDITVQCYFLFNKRNNKKKELIKLKAEKEKNILENYLFIKNLDKKEKDVLFEFIIRDSKSNLLQYNDRYVRILNAKKIIIDCGQSEYGNYHVYHIAPKYFNIINKIYLEVGNYEDEELS